MAYSRLAAIARRSYFDPDEDEKTEEPSLTEADVFGTSSSNLRAGPSAGGRGGTAVGGTAVGGGGGDEASDTIFQQVKMGPSTAASSAVSGSSDFTPGGRPRTAAAAAAAAGKRPGTMQVHSGPQAAESRASFRPADATPPALTTGGGASATKGGVPSTLEHGTSVNDLTPERPGTRARRRSIAASSSSSSVSTAVAEQPGGEAEKPAGPHARGVTPTKPVVATAEQHADQRPPSPSSLAPALLSPPARPGPSQLFKMEDFQERPSSRSGAPPPRRASQYREQQPASSSSKHVTTEEAPSLVGEVPSLTGTKQPMPTMEAVARVKSDGAEAATSSSSTGTVEEEGGVTVARPRTAGRRRNHDQAPGAADEVQTHPANHQQEQQQQRPLVVPSDDRPTVPSQPPSSQPSTIVPANACRGSAPDPPEREEVLEVPPQPTPLRRSFQKQPAPAMNTDRSELQPPPHQPEQPSHQHQEAGRQQSSLQQQQQQQPPPQPQEAPSPQPPEAQPQQQNKDECQQQPAAVKEEAQAQQRSLATEGDKVDDKVATTPAATSHMATDHHDDLGSAITITTNAPPSQAVEEEAPCYALVPVEESNADNSVHDPPNFVLVGDPHSQFEEEEEAEEGETDKKEAEGRFFDDYELIGREPIIITVTSQKSLFELLQRETAAAAAQQYLHRPPEEDREGEATQQPQGPDPHEQQHAQHMEPLPQAVEAGGSGWNDGLHYGGYASTEQQQAYQQGEQQQQQYTTDTYVCSECSHHQEDIPPSHYASAVGHFACLQAICTRDAYALMGFDSANRSTLFYASANDRADCCEFLIDWYAPLINLPDLNGDTPLHAAASSGSETCLHLLIHKGHAQTDPQNKMGMAPAHLAKNASILRALFEAGAHMSAQDRHGRSPLYLAAAMNRVECAAYLCEIADLDQLNLPDRRGDTPLHAAAFHGNQECLLLLLQFGAPPTVANCKGFTPIDLARKKGHSQCLKVLQEYHLHHSTNFDSVLFLATVEGHQAVKQQQRQQLQSKQSIRLDHYKDWLAYQYADGRTFWYNSKTGVSQWEQPAELVMSPTAASRLQSSSTDPSSATKLKEVGDWIKYSNAKTKSFYYNQQSGDFQWTQPPEFLHCLSFRRTGPQQAEDATQAQSQEQQQPPQHEVRGWQIYRDPATSKTFYYNPVTQMSSWEPPPDEEVGGAWQPEAEEEAKEVTELSDLGV